MLADDQNFVEVKSAYGKDMVTGFLRLNGETVGAVANRSRIYDEEGRFIGIYRYDKRQENYKPVKIFLEQ